MYYGHFLKLMFLFYFHPLGIVLFGDMITELHLLRFGLILSLSLPILKSILKVIYHQLPSKVRTLLRQFCVDLSSCLSFVASLIWRFTITPGTQVPVLYNYTIAIVDMREDV